MCKYLFCIFRKYAIMNFSTYKQNWIPLFLLYKAKVKVVPNKYVKPQSWMPPPNKKKSGVVRGNSLPCIVQLAIEFYKMFLWCLNKVCLKKKKGNSAICKLNTSSLCWSQPDRTAHQPLVWNVLAGVNQPWMKEHMFFLSLLHLWWYPICYMQLFT